MNLVAIFKGIFAIFESVPILRDAFFSALEAYYQKKITEAYHKRIEGIDALKNAQTIEDYQNALSAIVRNSAK